MTVSKMIILSRLNEASVFPAIDMKLAKSFLTAKDTTAVSETRILVKVSEAIRLWGARLKNTSLTGSPIHGAENFLERLQTLDPDIYLEQFGFIRAESDQPELYPQALK
jgi:hypothetical protein